jgi:type II secretion system protein G
MFNKFSTSRLNGRGFTLVEMLVVITIIGILSSVVMTSLNSSRAKARDSKRVGDIKQIQLALALYQDANSQYPDTLDKLTGYMPNIPTDPSNQASYAYAYRTEGSKRIDYHLGASLEANSPAFQDASKFTSLGQSGWTNGFVGVETAKCISAHVGDKCFDVKP